MANGLLGSGFQALKGLGQKEQFFLENFLEMHCIFKECKANPVLDFEHFSEMLIQFFSFCFAHAIAFEIPLLLTLPASLVRRATTASKISNLRRASHDPSDLKVGVVRSSPKVMQPSTPAA